MLSKIREFGLVQHPDADALAFREQPSPQIGLGLIMDRTTSALGGKP